MTGKISKKRRKIDRLTACPQVWSLELLSSRTYVAGEQGMEAEVYKGADIVASLGSLRLHDGNVVEICQELQGRLTANGWVRTSPWRVGLSQIQADVRRPVARHWTTRDEVEPGRVSVGVEYDDGTVVERLMNDVEGTDWTGERLAEAFLAVAVA